ncbi:hypothetical protein D3C87_1462320 [compost metagenome]
MSASSQIQMSESCKVPCTASVCLGAAMRPDTITMTMRQLDRLKVLQALADGRLTTGIAATRLA